MKIGASAWVSIAMCAALGLPIAAQTSSSGDADRGPVLRERPPAPPAQAMQPRLNLDVIVQDADGRPVNGLQPWDFKLTDNGSPSKILFMHAYDGDQSKPVPPVEVILAIDEINLPFTQISFVKQELSRFLNQADGRLPQPVSLVLLTDTGLRIQPSPTRDGKILLATVEKLQGDIRTINEATGSEGSIERFQQSVHQLRAIAANEARRPGRKLLVWIGPGWPMLDSEHYATPTEQNRKRYFQAIVELTNWLRTARITLYSVSSIDPNVGREFVYKSFLNGVPDWQRAAAGNLALKVLVAQTGGLILGPDNDLAAQINRCMADANRFYQLSFAPPEAKSMDEYHALRVQVDRPGLSVRTASGYYDEPPSQ